MLLTPEEYDVRFDELQKVRIELDEDPVANGLASINKKIAQLQGQKDRVGKLLLEAIKNKTEAQLILDANKSAYERELDKLLATDVEVQNQKNEKSRTAVANTKVSEHVLQTHYAENDFTTADAYYKCVQQIYTNLESVNSNLSRQISVVQMGMQIGEVTRTDLGDLFGKKMKLGGS